MKVLLVNDWGFPLGGAESYFFQLKEILRNTGVEVRTLSSDRERSSLSPQVDYQLPHTGHRKGLDGIFHPGVFFKMRSILSEFQPDLIHFQNVFYCLSPAVLLASRSYHSVMTLHDYYQICGADKCSHRGVPCESAFRSKTCSDLCKKKQYFFLEWFYRFMVRSAVQTINLFIAPGKYLQREFERNGYKNVHYLPHPFLENVSKNISENQKTVPGSRKFLYLGRLADQKGLEELLGAAKILLDRKCQFTLCIAGTGDLENTLRERVRKDQLQEIVSFAGRVDGKEKKELMESCFCLVLPSVWPEVAGLTIYEGAACGRPTIASDIGGIPDFITHQETGLLARPADAQSLSEQMEFALQNPEKMQHIGMEAQKKSYSWSGKEYGDKLLGLYEKVLQKQ